MRKELRKNFGVVVKLLDGMQRFIWQRKIPDYGKAE